MPRIKKMMLCHEVCWKCNKAISEVAAAHFERLWEKGLVFCTVVYDYHHNARIMYSPLQHIKMGYYEVVNPPPFCCPYELEHVVNNVQSNPIEFDPSAPWVPPVLKKLHKAINALDWEDFDDRAVFDLGCPCIPCRIERGETGFDVD